MVLKCKNCNKSILLQLSDKTLMNRVIYCDHCNKIIFFTELPYAIVCSILKWFLLVIIYCLNSNYIFIYFIFWSFIEKIFMIISYKFFYRG